MICWTCGKEIEEFANGKIPIRATCPHCSAWLHCCKNCKNYSPGRRNDCLIPDTEYIADREANNFCDDFSPLCKGPGTKKDDGEAFRNLFK